MKRTTTKLLLRLLAGLVTAAFYAATIHKGGSMTLSSTASPDDAGDESDLSNQISTPANLSVISHSSFVIATATNPPVTATLAATEITATSAMLGGLVNPQGGSALAWFEYGTSTNYIVSTSLQSLSNGTTAVAVNVPVGGLTPGTIYHFRIAATNVVGAAVGSDMTFTTPATAPTIATQPPGGISVKGATLNATVNPNGTPTTAYFEYGPSPSYGSRTPLMSLGSGTNAVSVSSSVNGLSAGFTYHFRIIAGNAGGTALGSDSTFATSSRHIAKK